MLLPVSENLLENGFPLPTGRVSVCKHTFTLTICFGFFVIT